MPLVKVNDINMYYELYGHGEPIVLIPGLASDLSDNAFVTRRLSQKFRVLALDNRGAGRSDKPDAPYTIEQMAGDAAAVMDAAGVKRAQVIGISMGGRIAMALALQHPEKVKSLVLVSTFARQAVGSSDLVRRRNALNRIPIIRLLMSRNPQPQYAFERQLAASRSYDCSARLGEILVPVLVLHGRDDKVAPLALAEEIHAAIPGSQMATFPGGHLFFWRSADKFCNAAIDFLAGVK